MLSRLVLLLLVVLAFAPPARAFTIEGHEVIEAAAYRELIAQPNVQAAGVPGRAVVAFLIGHGVLVRPRCFGTEPGSQPCGRSARLATPIWFWPELGSGTPDLLVSRQFGHRGQCYHFMADSEDWRESRPDPAAGVPTGMSRQAYARCLRLVTSLFDEILKDPFAAAVRGRGIYNLMHAVADSFSRAHVERAEGGAGKIRYLRVWIFRDWIRYLFDRQGFDPRLHHELVDPRDTDYIDRDRRVGGKRCEDYVAPYQVPMECLSVEGKAAEETLVDLLVTFYLAMHPVDRASLDDGPARAAWRGFVDRRLASEYAPSVFDEQRAVERDWQPNLLVGGRLRHDLDDNGWDAGLTVGMMRVVRGALPLIPLATATVGYGRFDAGGRFLLRGDMSFLLPVWGGLGVGVTPLGAGIDCSDDFSGWHGDLFTVPARLSFFIVHPGIWLDLSGPGYSWVEHAWSDRLALTVGATFDVVQRLKPAPPPPSVAGEAAWNPPDLQGNLLNRTPTSYAVFVEGALAASDSNYLLSAGVEARREHDANNRRAGLGFALDLSYQHGRLAGLPVDDGRLVPMLTYYLVTSILALRVSPLSLAVGKWGDDAYIDVAAQAQLSLSFSAFEVTLGAPVISYVHREENEPFQAALRFAWLLRD